MSQFWRSLLVSLGTLAAFVIVELAWIVDSLFYHWFTFAAAGTVLAAIPLAWWPLIRKYSAPVRLALTAASLVCTLALLCAVTISWPAVFVYEGAGGFDAVAPLGGFLPAALFALLVVAPIVILGENAQGA